MFKFIFDLLTDDPLGLPIEWHYEYLTLAVIGAVTYEIAYRCVGDVYHVGAIAGRTRGSFFYWLICFTLFAESWTLTYDVNVAARGLTENRSVALCILSGIMTAVGIAVAVLIFIGSHNKKQEKEAATDA